MNPIRSLSLTVAVAVLVLTGCSSTPTHKDTGTIRAASFSFIDSGARPAPAFADGRAAMHTSIQDAISQHLTARGMTRMPSGGDVTVAYLIITGNNVSTVSINDHFGYGRSTGELQDKAHRAYTNSKNPNYFEAGTLLVDIIDPKTFELLWRGHVTRPLLRNLPADERAARLQEYVDSLLGELRLATP